MAARPRGRSIGATYRLQLRPGFGFGEAAAIAGYLAGLGVELAYLSPIAEAVPGSVHGYDGTDPTAVRAELGGRQGFDRLVAELHRHGLGVLLDIVPNHLATWPSGPWWGDVLRHGRQSGFAAVFDIDWEQGGCGDGQAGDEPKVALPILGAPLDEVLSSNELRIELAGGSPVLCYGSNGPALPIADGTGQPGDDVARVLELQHYRLCHWRDRGARNYRRFFDIDGLVGVRVEDPAVFELTHRLVAELVEAGAVDGLRVDHVDGLADPASYLRRLHDLCDGLPIVVEKILTGDEPLQDWPVAGTTGYEIADDISGALVDPAGLVRLVDGARAEGEDRTVDAVADGKLLAAEETFAAEREKVAALLGADAAALTRILVDFPVYRSYVSGEGASEFDAAVIEAAAPGELAGRLLSASEGTARFQQLSAPVMAKGVEDTAWYRLVGPLPFLEVGGDPSRDRSDGLERLHSRSGARAASGYGGLVAGTTHDTKRSADCRARLLALSEVAPEFEAGLVRFAELSPLHKTGTGKLVGNALELRLIAATLLAVLPADGEDADWRELSGRVGEALRKSAREAKANSSWTDPDEEYEEALIAIAEHTLADGGAVLHDAFGDLVEEVASLGATIALSQVVLRSFLPGAPDCYQGDESWNFSLVDPDNRRPVDFARLERDLDLIGERPTPEAAAALRAGWKNGLVKQHVTRQCLLARAFAPAAVAPGAGYLPLQATGAQSDSVVAFARSAAGGLLEQAIVVTARMPRRLIAAPGDLPAGRRAWGSTVLELPAALGGTAEPGHSGDRARAPATGPGVWHNFLTGSEVEPEAGHLELRAVLADLPVAVLVRTGRTPSAGPRPSAPRR